MELAFSLSERLCVLLTCKLLNQLEKASSKELAVEMTGGKQGFLSRAGEVTPGNKAAVVSLSKTAEDAFNSSISFIAQISLRGTRRRRDNVDNASFSQSGPGVSMSMLKLSTNLRTFHRQPAGTVR